MPHTYHSNFSAKHLHSLAVLFILVFIPPISAQENPPPPRPITPGKVAGITRKSHGLIGRVRRVQIERAKLAIQSGQTVELARELLRETIYSQRGNVIDDVTHMAEASPLEGKGEYKYDDKGNVSEVTLRDVDGSVLSKEVYTYEFDPVGNWKKRITSAAVVEGGEAKLAPVEVIYRTITYYYDQMVVKRFRAAPSIRKAPGRPAAGIISSTLKAETKPPAAPSLVLKPDNRNKQPAFPPDFTPPSKDTSSAAKDSTTGPPEAAGDRVASGPLPEVHAERPSSQASNAGGALHNLGLAYYKAGQYEKAVETLKQAALMDPNAGEVNRALIMVSADLGRLGREAAARKDGAAQYDIGNAYSRLGQFGLAVEAYNQAIRLNLKAPDLYNELGIALAELSRYEDAAKAFKGAIRLRPNSAEAHNNLGLTYYRMGEQEEAIKYFKRAISYDLKGAEVHYNLGLAYVTSGDREGALEQHKILKTVAPELADKLLAEISGRITADRSTDKKQ